MSTRLDTRQDFVSLLLRYPVASRRDHVVVKLIYYSSTSYAKDGVVLITASCQFEVNTG